jgi:hypothetical protein
MECFKYFHEFENFRIVLPSKLEAVYKGSKPLNLVYSIVSEMEAHDPYLLGFYSLAYTSSARQCGTTGMAVYILFGPVDSHPKHGPKGLVSSPKSNFTQSTRLGGKL